MSRVLVTGRGLITPLGNGLKANEDALRAGRSGIVRIQEWIDRNLDSHVGGVADQDPPCTLLDKKRRRFTAANARMAVAAAEEAFAEAGLSIEDLKKYRVAVIGGCAGSAYQEVFDNAYTFYSSRSIKRISPFVVPRVMPSSAVANLSLIFGITGESYDISSACASGAHAIMAASRLIKGGLYDIVLAGGADELNWVQSLGFNCIRALSTKYNDRPEQASRPFDHDRDGFVIAEGAGFMVLEAEENALRRGVRPIAEITGASANSNGTDMVVPDAVASANSMRTAIKDAGLTPKDIDYINTHGTATTIGDPVEMEALKTLFVDFKPAINSTKSMTGHMIGATGAVETIFCTIMIDKSFISPSLNCENPEPEFAWADIVHQTRENVPVRHTLKNSFAFGGTNVCLVISKYDDK